MPVSGFTSPSGAGVRLAIVTGETTPIAMMAAVEIVIDALIHPTATIQTSPDVRVSGLIMSESPGNIGRPTIVRRIPSRLCH